LNAGLTNVVQSSPLTVEVSNVFNGDLKVTDGTIITLKCGKLRNPRLLEPTATDIVVQHLPSSLSSDPLPQWNFKVHMKKLPSFLDFKVEIASLVTGESTEYNFKFVSGHEMVNGQVIEVDLTKDITLLEDDLNTENLNEGI
jgi:hypothetical protein